ncbi:MAG: alpha-D-ribose 1-methylphosphonate 5-triphosphate synthase subunit PhnG [Pseudomonadales bacterium]|jgi:alpha-D-ribose 1-methylphosphonate 5-triphosphate synthase subunit PhnG
MNTEQRQNLLSILAKSSLKDIQSCWHHSLDDYQFKTIRPPQTGMVMAVARTETTGEPFNLGEVSVTRCALRLESGETGVGYSMGSDKDQVLHIALIDALAQVGQDFETLSTDVINPLKQKIADRQKRQKAQTDTTKVDFLTIIRGEDA